MYRRAISALTRFAEVLNTVIVTVLFAACYLLIVPIFYLLLRWSDPLRLRGDDTSDSFWIDKTETPLDRDSLERMG